jgi:glycosyltransferase involved in cell wall biosynthesis
VLLPPGTDPSQPYLGDGEDDVVGAIVQLGPTSGFELLFAAMEIVRRSRPAARLVVVSRSVDPAQSAALPSWVSIVASGRSSLAEALAPARVCVLPLPVNRYTDFAVAVRLYDLAAFGKPIVATATGESRRFLVASGAGLSTAENPEAMAEAIGRLLSDAAVAEACSRRARDYATDPANTWDARARTVRARLLGTPA